MHFPKSFSVSFPRRALSAAALCCAALLGTLSPVFQAEARTPEEVRDVCRSEGRPCVGLVLSGGGARGFAHVGVIRVLEELGVKVDVVTGTSMGCMVGGAYAAGYNAAQLQEIVLGVDWGRMMAPRAPRKDLPWRLKQNDYQNLTDNSMEVSFTGKVKLPDSMVPSEELDLFLIDKTGPVSDVRDLSSLAVPFAGVATDLVTGDRVELNKDINLGQAMRASMSVPGAFSPVPRGDQLLVDGGLVDNLPVEMARRMGADVVIAINVGTPLLKRDELGNVVTVMAQMVNLLTEQNVERSKASLTDADILITPDLEKYTSADFNSSREIIVSGYDAASAVREKLRRFAVPKDKWIAWESARESAVLPADRSRLHNVAEIRVDGLEEANPEAVKNQIDLPQSGLITDEQVADASRREWATGDYTTVGYHFEPGPEGTEVLVFEPKEKKPGYSSFRIGGSLETDFHDSQNFNVVLSHELGWINSWGAELHTDLQFGEKKKAQMSFFQPLGAGSNWFTEPYIKYEWAPYDVYEDDEPVARFRNETFESGLSLGYTISRLGYIRGIAGYTRQRTNRELGSPEYISSFQDDAGFAGLHLMLDTLDNINFPTKGFYLDARVTALTTSSFYSDRHAVIALNAVKPFSLGRWTTILTGKYGRSTMPSYFSLGGAFELSGSPYGRWTGSDVQFGSVRVQRNMSDILGNISMPVWAGVTAEVGRAWNKAFWIEPGEDRWQSSYGLYLGADSVIGPVSLLAGRTRGGKQGLYFFWGHKL